MNVLFLTISKFPDVEQYGIYTDLIRTFRDNGHNVYVVNPLERRYQTQTNLKENKGIHILGVRTLNMQKCNFIEKGIGILLVGSQFKNAIKHYLGNIRFDLILYSTPPITFTKAVKYVKQRDKAFTYLLLKDIFPQNAVDINLIRSKGLLHRCFKYKEKQLYCVSDYIGCMSKANVDFVIKNNPYIKTDKVEVNPNSMELFEVKSKDKETIRGKYGLPLDRKIFIYGGNLGKPQAIDFIIECMNANLNRQDCFFLIVGAGTEYYKLENWVDIAKPQNLKLISYLPNEQYNELLSCCDVGMIFLDYRFTIPNFPSRLLTYLNNRLPVLVSTDRSCDMGQIAEDNSFGFYSPSNDVSSFTQTITKFINSDIPHMGDNAYRYLVDNYTVDRSYKEIVKHIQNK